MRPNPFNKRARLAWPLLALLGCGAPKADAGPPPETATSVTPVPVEVTETTGTPELDSPPTAPKAHPIEPGAWTSFELSTAWSDAPVPVRLYRSEGNCLPTQCAVTVLLHGMGGRAEDWETYAQTEQIYEALVLAGTAPAGYLVAPSGGDGYWTDWNDGVHLYGSLVHDALIGWLRDQDLLPEIHNPDRLALVGISMGGFGALSITLRHPDVFGRVAGMSPTDMARAVAQQPNRTIYTQVYGQPINAERVAQTNPLDRVREGLPTGLSRIVVSWGDAEPSKFRDGGRDLRTALHDQPIFEAWEIEGGRHGWKWWTPVLRDVMQKVWSEPATHTE